MTKTVEASFSFLLELDKKAALLARKGDESVFEKIKHTKN